MGKMSLETHSRFLDTADTVSPRLANALKQIGPLNLVKRNRKPLAPTLCRMVAGQQLSTKASTTIWGRVQEAAGNLPLMDFVSTTSLEALRACGLSHAKAKSMKSISESEADGALDKRLLGKMSHEDRSAELTKIWGVGKWTADMVGMFYFGDQDVWPEGDVTVINTLQRMTSRRRNPGKTAAMFAPHRSFLALYMYHIADAPPDKR